MTSDDKIDRIREHLAKHQHREQAFFSTAGVQLLLTQRDALKAQVERLVLEKVDEIGKMLVP